MKDFISNLLTLILVITPFLCIVLSLALIAHGDGFGFAIFSVLGIISSVLVCGIFKLNNYENK